MLPAPPERKLLCAPKIAGLLPARAGLTPIEITFAPPRTYKRLTRKEIEAIIGPIRTIEELDAELEELVDELIFDLRPRAERRSRKHGQ